jgi:hypothetical protein
MNLGPTAVLRRPAARASDTPWVVTLGIECVLALETNIEEPNVEEIVLVGETLIWPEHELRQSHRLRIPKEQQAARSRSAKMMVTDAESVLIFV